MHVHEDCLLRIFILFLRPFVWGTPTTHSEGLLLRVGALHCAPTYNRVVVQHVVFNHLGLAQPHECSSKAAIYHANSSATSSNNNLYRGRNCCTTHASKATYRYFLGTRLRLPRRVITFSDSPVLLENQDFLTGWGFQKILLESVLLEKAFSDSIRSGFLVPYQKKSRFLITFSNSIRSGLIVQTCEQYGNYLNFGMHSYRRASFCPRALTTQPCGSTQREVDSLDGQPGSENKKALLPH